MFFILIYSIKYLPWEKKNHFPISLKDIHPQHGAVGWCGFAVTMQNTTSVGSFPHAVGKIVV